MITSERKTNQDVLNKTACSNCSHDVSEHDNGSGKCYGLDYDGSAYSSCKCQNFKSEFKITVKIPKDE